MIDVGTMARKHAVRIGLDAPQRAEPFLTSMRLGWTWSPVDSARTYTNEEDLVAELLGREQARGVITEPPWLRLDIELLATSRMASHCALQRTTRLRPKATASTYNSQHAFGTSSPDPPDAFTRLLPAGLRCLSADSPTRVLVGGRAPRPHMGA